jgi:hypothetical protein
MSTYAIRMVTFTLLIALNSIAVSSSQELHVREIPLPKEATDVSYMKSRGDIRMLFPGDMKKAGEFYQMELTKQQWIKSVKDNVQKNFWVQTFKKQNRELEIRTEVEDVGSEIRITPKGYLWDEDFTPRPEDIPIPENAQQLKYDDFLSEIVFQCDDSPKQLVDFYASKLDPQVWQKPREDNIREKSGIVHRVSGIATLWIYIDVEQGKTQVKIDTKGMSWDQIKLANANAKKSKESASGSSSPAGGNSVPKRFNKPIRGIEKLEKLPSIGSVTIDGKKTPLTEVFAYELIAYGKWRTHIVATSQPIKQDVLLKLLLTNVPEEKWGDQWRLPSPNLKLILDEDDSLWSMQLLADKVPSSATEITGEAIVEAGRARGTAKLIPRTFFKHSVEAEITFDTMLLNPSAAPRKLLENAPKLENVGKIIFAGKSFALPYVTAYQERNAHKVIRVVLTEKPIDSAKIRMALEQTGEVGQSVFGFQPQISFALDENDVLQSMFLWCDGASVNWSGINSVQTAVRSEGDRVRGTVSTNKKEEVLGKSLEFQSSFDTSVIRASRAK